MAAIWLVLRNQLLRPRRIAVAFAIALLVGIAGGAALTAAAGARRTETAYERLLQASNTPELVVRPVAGPDAADPADVARLPHVGDRGIVRRYYLTFNRKGPPSQRPSIFASASVDGHALYEIGRPRVVEGRLPRPGRVDEIAVNTRVHDEVGLDVGDRLHGSLVQIDASVPDGIRTVNVDLRVVGIGIGADEIGVPEVSGFQTMLTPAFNQRYSEFAIDWNVFVNLRPGAKLDGFRREVHALAKNALNIASRTDDEERVAAATNPPVISLWVFAGVLAIVALLVVGQTIARELFVASRDDPLLGALGVTRRERFLLGVLRVVPIALVGAGVSAITAILASPLMPIGVVEDAEPNPGIEINLAVLGVGAVLVIGAVLGAAAVPSWRLARRRVADEASMAGGSRPSRVTEALARAGAPPTAVAGTRFALESGRGPTAVPVRSTIVGTAAAIVALVAAITFSSGLSHLVESPRLWGSTWDVNASVGADPRQLNGEFTLKQTLLALQGLVERGLRMVDTVDRWSIATNQTITLNRRSVPAIGVARSGGAKVPLREGRLPERVDEVALGAKTADDLAAGVGENVHDNKGGRLRVVGIAVLPHFSVIGGADEAGLGRGALFTLPGLLRAAPDPYTRTYLITLKRGRDVDAAVRRITDATEPYAFNVATPPKPTKITNLEDIEGRPAALAAILAALAIGTLIHALISAVQRRRRDLAILQTLGFTRGQTALTIAWHATTVAAVGLLFGVPLGIIGGRFATGMLADGYGTVSEPVTSWLWVSVVFVATLFVANAIAALPGYAAARTRPARILRSE
jgi:hypothetical protein